MFTEYLYRVGELPLFLFLFAALALALEVAYLWGRRLADRVTGDIRSRVSSIAGTMCAFLALLLGFTFSMALMRFDARKNAFQQEVNDIGVVYDQTKLLSYAQAAESRKLLGQYVTERVNQYWRELPAAEEKKVAASADALADRLWNLAVAAGANNVMPAPVTAVYLNNLTAMFRDRTERTLQIRNHVPEAVILLLFLVAVAAVAAVGYAGGLAKGRSTVLRLGLILVVAGTLVITIDLDRPRRGLVRIDQQAMADLRDDILAQNATMAEPISGDRK